jgi:SAM-dependent methyltransferase
VFAGHSVLQAGDGQSGTTAVRLFRNRNNIIYQGRACVSGEPHIIEHGRIGVIPIHFRRKAAAQTNGKAHTLCHLLQLDRLEQRHNRDILVDLARIRRSLGDHFHAECYYWDAYQAFSPSEPGYASVVAELLDTYERISDPYRAAELREKTQELGNCAAEVAQRIAALQHELNGGRGSEPAREATPSTQFVLPRLYLGAGSKRLPGYTHVDIVEGSGIDIVHDLNELPWPWDDGSIDSIVAEDVVEHLDINLVEFCNEAWRVMAPDGELFVRTPHHSGDSSWIDPTHRWHLNEQAFHYLDSDTYWGRTYAQYTSKRWRILSLGVRGPQNIHAILIPRDKNGTSTN